MLHKPQTKSPNAIDIHVGSRIRLQRALKGMSQTTLAEGLGVTFQQVQKYEKGTNRVGSSRLQAIANILGVPVAWFFEEGPDSGSTSPQEPETGAGREITQFLNSLEGLALNRAFVKIQDDKIRRKVVDLVKSLAKDASE
ncbi:helix-turn-helix transcriptional regulator (plasmid) [Agrobacterium leguminum]|uniref:helix-turn-helix domain-containing protein n=1 Tax=Agrobacterium leguminum TaxID=2792015 RepID=UPI0010C9998F|nr:helix-turn-helix transcriptional regulator [Agrobacterium leguminum]WFS69600.1 helix-turn-helix transcriptional regulator [Agrobacterium leguminum]